MANSLVKRQHYVPQTYLRNFATKRNEEFYVKAVPIKNPKKESIIELNTNNICAESHLYTLPGETTEQKMLLEKFYSDEIEHHYNNIYQILTDPNRKTLTAEERELIITTVVTMFYRTTKWITQHNDIITRVYTQMFELCNQTGKDYFYFEKIKVSIKDKTLEQFLKEYKLESKPSQVISQLEVALNLIKVRLQNDNIFISKMADDDCEFITSDNPVIVQNVSGGSIVPFDPSNIMKLPIDKKSMLFLMPDGDKEARNLIIRHNVSGLFCRTEKLISNAEQFQKAERFIIGDDNSLTSYLETKDLAERPLSEKERNEMSSFEDFVKKGKDLGLL